MNADIIKLKLEVVKKQFNPDSNRVQSASSSKTFLQCPRKYHYIYNLKLPQNPSIHLIRGSIMHDVKEDFFKIQLLEDNFKEILKEKLICLFKEKWKKSINALEELKLTKKELKCYYEETQDMHLTWLDRFIKEIEIVAKEEKTTINKAFELLTPQTEVELICQEIGLKCYLDTRLETRNGVDIGDYKSSKKDDVYEHKLQMSYYALAEYISTGELPRMLIVDYFKHGKRYIEPNQELLIYALKNLEEIHKNTKTKEIEDYPRNSTPLCKWSNARGSGECDFYKHCFV